MKINELDDLGARPSKMIFEDELYAIIAAATEVYYKLGSGFLEPVYQEALAIEFNLRGIPFDREKELRRRFNNGSHGRYGIRETPRTYLIGSRAGI